MKVRGRVNPGDFIVPSGLDDGVAIAVSPADYLRSQQIHVIGTAWNSAPGDGLHRVTTAIGVQSASATAPLVSFIAEQARQVEALKVELAELKKLLSHSNRDGNN